MNDQLTNAPPEVVAAAKRLTQRQLAFAFALPAAADHEKAMLEAGYSARTAHAKAGSLAKHPDVAIVVNWLVGNALQLAGDSVERVLTELVRMSLSDARELFDEKGCLRPIHQWPEDIARSVSSVEVFEEFSVKGDDRKFIGWTKKVKLWDKNKALDTLVKIKGYYRPEQHEHVHKIDGLAGLLKEIDGADTGPGPARSRRA